MYYEIRNAIVLTTIETGPNLVKCCVVNAYSFLMYNFATVIKLAYPSIKPSIKQENGKEYIRCICRKKWVVLTPEEWVRQNFILYLSEVLQYPVSLMAVEKSLVLGDIGKRFDIVVFKKEQPWMLVECKEMNVPITERTFHQMLRYNISLQAAVFVLTNGTACFAFEKRGDALQPLNDFPVF
jgi:hypothetical protein